MPAEQALVSAAPLEEELAALQPVLVPLHWTPDGAVCPDPSSGSPAGQPDPRRAAPGGPCPPGPGQPPCQPPPHLFALLIVETLAGVRPVRQLAPLLSRRAGIHLHRLRPLFTANRRPRVLRMLTSAPAAGVVEMTLVVNTGPRTRALAVRLEQAAPTAATRRDRPAARWLCTAIEAA